MPLLKTDATLWHQIQKAAIDAEKIDATSSATNPNAAATTKSDAANINITVSANTAAAVKSDDAATVKSDAL